MLKTDEMSGGVTRGEERGNKEYTQMNKEITNAVPSARDMATEKRLPALLLIMPLCRPIETEFRRWY